MRTKIFVEWNRNASIRKFHGISSVRFIHGDKKKMRETTQKHLAKTNCARK